MGNSDIRVADEEEKKLEYCNCNSNASESGFPADDISSNTVDKSFDHFRMETAWAQAEAEHQRKTNPLVSSPLDPDQRHVSPLMARSDSLERPKCLDTTMNTRNNIGQSKQRGDNANNESVKIQRSAINKSLLQRYRTFLQKHEPSLDILERIMERFVFYRYLFNHDHSGMRIELYYASWNIIRWVNDVVLMGWGDGMGMTIGTRQEWIGSNNKLSSEEKRSFQYWVLTKMHVIVPVLRAILTATTCVYPALEAWSRRPMRQRPFVHGTALRYNESQPLEEWEYSSTTDLSPQARRVQWERRQSRAADLSYSVEKIRFISRLTLLSISWWTQYRRKQLLRLEASTVPSLLRRGGELDPCEELLPLQASDMAAAVSQYKGKRTGRRSISSISTVTPSQFTPTGTSKQPSFVRYISNLVAGKHNILYFHIIGELLHIFRPLYWSRSESIDWKHRTVTHEHPRTSRRGSAFSISLWKAWLLSLIMDIVSDEILDITTGCRTNQTPEIKLQRHSLLSRSTGRNSPYSPVSSVIESEHDELKWRRGRRSMYLLRSPAYKAITLPLMSTVTRLVSKVPSFGLCRWASEYIMDMMSYWNEHRFMLE